MQSQIKPENPLTHRTEKLPLLCPILTQFLNGGIPYGSITEIFGESSSGKTQLSLQLLLSSSTSSSSIFIHSEFPFPLTRLRHLSLSLPPSIPNPLNNIFIHGTHSPNHLLSLLSTTDSFLSNPPTNLPIKLIVIDSIAALFRSDFDNTPSDLMRRSALFFRIAGKLKEQARRFGLAVVVTNQVVDVVEGSEMGGFRVGNYGELWSSGRRVLPALGLSWGNCVNTRLFLSRRDEVGEDGGGVRTRRIMRVVFAPHLPESSVEFVILREGVFGVSL